MTLIYFFLFINIFFGTLYEWAGKTRTVNISKDEMLFAPVKYIDKALEDFAILLKTKLSKCFKDKNELSEKLAIIHNEFNLIHPFREGNGRTIRLFLDLLVVSLGYDPIDWGKTTSTAYLNACIAGVSGKHESMTKIIKKGLDVNLE
ncbi:MAG: Fic family protein [Candidatus Uhrbacteria bacterium]